MIDLPIDNKKTLIIEDPFDININLDDRLNVVSANHHYELLNLDYTEAGHTGFAPSRLNLMSNVASSVTNDRLVIMANVDDITSKITVSELMNRIIRPVDDDQLPSDLQKGQYILKKINN